MDKKWRHALAVTQVNPLIEKSIDFPWGEMPGTVNSNHIMPSSAASDWA